MDECTQKGRNKRQKNTKSAPAARNSEVSGSPVTPIMGPEYEKCDYERD